MTTETNQEFLNAWGAVDNDEANSGGGQKERPDFVKLEIGDNDIRVLDMVPHTYKERWVNGADGGNGASLPFFGNDDPFEKENREFMKKVFAEADKKGLKDKARKDFLRDHGYKKQPWNPVREKHIIHVLDRKDGQVKLLDKGNGVFKGLKKYAMHKKYGDLRNYDITIEMEGDLNDFQTIEYTVAPDPEKTPITEAEQKLYEEKKIDLAEFKSPHMTPDQAYLIAKGATFQEVLGNGGDSADTTQEKADPEQLPADETPAKEEPAKEAPAVEKGEALSEEELNGIQF